MKLLIKNSEAAGFVDYTRYVLDGSLSIEDSINVPTLTSFQLAAVDNVFTVPKRSAYFKVISEIYAQGGGLVRANQSVGSTNFNVIATSEPWKATDPNYPFFDGGVNNPGTAPISVPVTPGNTYVFSYVSGTVFLHLGTIGPYLPDGSGGPQGINTQSPGYQYFPGLQIGVALVGGYADASGNLIAPPFYIGANKVIGPVPQNATQIVMGVNDFPWGDNTGNWLINVAILNDGKTLSTGFITNEPERVYLGLNPHLTKFNLEQYQYNINGTSDEWLLNSNTVPFIPAFVNQTDSQILASLARALAPNMNFDTSLMASGTLVPFFQYDPSQTWSDIAKTFADANRFHYKVLNGQILYQPFGDRPLGISFDDQAQRATKRNLFPSELKTGVLTVPPVNDCIVIGDTEPQANWENYFVGDGFTSNFTLKHQVFQGTSSQLLTDDWTENSFQSGVWVEQDPQGVIFLSDNNGNALGALNVAQQGVTGVVYQPQAFATFVQAQNGLELGGGINLQHGQFVFNNQCNGLLGSLFGSSTFTPGNVLCGFSVTGQSAAGPFTCSSVQINAADVNVTVVINGTVTGVQPGNVVVAAAFVGASFLNGRKHSIISIVYNASTNQTTIVMQGIFRYAAAYGPAADSGNIAAASNDVLITASGAAGVVIQPVYQGINVGPRVVSQINHQYVLQTWLGAQTKTRYTRPYTNLTQSATYGNQNLAAAGTISFVITDVNLGQFVIQAQNPLFGLFPATPPPIVTKYSVRNTNLPPFALYCLLNAINLNLSINYTNLSLPPQGFLSVQSLTGASGGKNPWLPSQLSIEIPYQLGFGMINQTAQVSQQGEAFALSFYTDTIPSVGARIRFQSWAAGQAVSRVTDPAAIAVEAAISGDNGIRAAIMQNLSPLPRTSDECEAAAAAAIRDREFPQFQGTYTFVQKPYNAEQIFSPLNNPYPIPGRFFFINSPVRAITGQNFFLNTTRIQVIEWRDEVLNISLDYGPDLYLENLLPSFLEREQTLLVPKQTTQPPSPVFLSQVLNAHLPTPDNARVTAVVNSLTGNYITIDVGSAPVTGIEVRNIDGGWGESTQGLIGVFTTQQFSVARTIRDQTWYLRTRNGSVFSRFSKALRVVYPLIPSAPALVQANSNTAVFDFAGDVRDIYGIEVKANSLSGVFFVQFPNVPEDSVYQFARNSILVPTDPAAAGMPVKVNNNVGVVYNPPSNSNPFPFGTQFVLGDIIFSSCPNDSSFAGVEVVSQVVSATGSSGGTPVGNKVTLQTLHGWLLPYVGAKGTYNHPFPLNSGISVPYAEINPFSLVFNRVNNRQYPMLNRKFDAAGNSLGDFNLNATMTQNYDMAITGQFIVPAGGNYSMSVAHDDGFLYSIGGGASQVSGPNFNISFPQARTTVLGLTTLGGYNHSGNHSLFDSGPGPDTFVVNFPSAGTYNFEFNYSNWESAETLQVLFNGADILPSTFTPSLSGSPWGIGWFDYRQPYPDTVGQAIQYGLNQEVGTEQLYFRPTAFSIAASGSISGGNTGLCTIYTQGNHGFTLGQQVIIGVGWQTFPTGIGNTVPTLRTSDTSSGTGNPEQTHALKIKSAALGGAGASAIKFSVEAGSVNGILSMHGRVVTVAGGTTTPIKRSANCAWGGATTSSAAPNTVKTSDQIVIQVDPGDDIYILLDVSATSDYKYIGAAQNNTGNVQYDGQPNGDHTNDADLATNFGFSSPSNMFMFSNPLTIYTGITYPRLPNTGAVFCGQQVITAVPQSNAFQFISPILSNPATLVPGSNEAVLAQYGVVPQYLNGVVSPMPTPFNLQASSGIIIQRPVFAPSDLIVDFTNADIAEELGILQLLSPNGRVGGLQARFYNLTWDYSAATIIPSFSVPQITGVFVDPTTQAVSWNLSQGRPTGYRVLMSDPTTGQVLNRFTVDNPQNPQLLKQFQMSQLDFANPRLISITPFDVTGDGVPVTVFHPGSSAGGGSGVTIFTQCLDVRTFGAIGDGVTDDTAAVQNALNQALTNANGSFPATSECIVCIPSSMQCLVTPQFLDGTPGVKGFGPTAGCLKIGQGVTLRLDGQLVVGSNGNFLSNPWVALENYSAYPILVGTNDQNITIEGAGFINCNSTALAHSVGAIKFQGVSGCKIKDIGIQQQNLYGLYCVGCYDTNVENLQVLPVSEQSGYLVFLDKCLNSRVGECSVDGSFGTNLQMSFVADYGSQGTIIEGNSVYSIEGTMVSRLNYGFDDRLVGNPYSGLRISNNVFVSGSISGSFAVTCVASGTLDYGIAIDGNSIIGSRQGGIQIGNLSDALIVNNTVENNAQGIVKASGTILQTTSIFNNIVKGNVIDFPVVTSATNPIFNDGSSTATMYNPAIDRQLYSSFAPQQPTILGVTPAGKSGYVSPPTPPNDYYAVTLTGSNVTGAVISSSGTLISISPFRIIWPDKTNTYSGGSVSAPSIYNTGLVFVDDPYRDANPALLQFGFTTNPSDLATSAGRYLLGVIALSITGNGSALPGGNIPASAIMSLLQQPYDIGCTWKGTIAAAGKIIHLPIVCNLQFLANMLGSRAHLLTGPGALVTIPILKNGVQFATLSFTTGAVEGSFTGSATAFAPYNKDVLTVDLTAVSDVTASDLGMILRAFRTFIGV